ncbi:GntR family transcriptional regulator [Desulfosporosinus sp. BICA1-9]|uniref:GntR family transcriptional regulator n=1 Tax=Desulfosporosinus sp. BICA1-9 TaxID=1531958 RepID=UPI00054B3D9F|nr:GntR family transcriptional regulator [Desulfosporosinus sp. BICA1-9]KJS48997.1 MAG: UbiC family transcriptional regulator [Peptococcaceae bacterium BRH_c23]KJS78074.1 MAG: UbiC family transcriptional regulator [Desulfosporosinus sp. BICA1-9]HBW34137.1 GntR family transcriptional regulator [Desulfosporosinus sp.]
MELNKTESIPLHYQLTTTLRDAIRDGVWNLGDVFPTDKDLMVQYGVSSTTVRRSVGQLVQEGLLDRKAGKGTFVKNKPVEETLGLLTGFFEEMAIRGFSPSADLINLCPIEVTAKELERVPELGIFNKQKLFLIEKVQKLNNEPIAYLQSYWPYEYGSRMAASDLTETGLYAIAAKELGLVLTKAEQTIGAGIAHKKVAQYLGVRTGFPILTMNRIGYCGEQPVELSLNSYRADRYKYKVLLQQNTGRNIEGLFFS